MKKIFIVLAVIAIFAIALAAIGNKIESSVPNESTDVSNGSFETVTSNIIDGTEKVDTTDTSKYTYDIKIYEYGTSTELGTLNFDSSSDVVTVRISGNSLIFESSDVVKPIQFTDYNSIDTVRPTTVLSGSSVVYITYTKNTSGTHIHSYISDDNATCTTSGTKSCACGATLSVPALGHQAEDKILESCNDIAYCIRCGIPMESGPHIDTDNDGYCEAGQHDIIS